MSKLKKVLIALMKWFQRAENWWIIAGFLTASFAISVPFILLNHFNQKFVIESFNGELGVVGDFLGGTTVGLLSLTSILFVTAAIVMQKKELKLQREEVEKTRMEYAVTNATMKKQQFDSTFFNMINLHHSITKDIMISETTGRIVMRQVLKNIHDVYEKNVYENYISKLKNEILLGEENLLNDLILNEFIVSKRDEFSETGIRHIYNKYGYVYDDELILIDNFRKSLKNGTNEEWNDIEIKIREDFTKEVASGTININEYLGNIDFKKAVNSYSTPYIEKFKQEFINEPLKELKVEAFEKVYNDLEGQLGHYFRNLYHIVKLIDDQTFFEDVTENNKEQQKYRAILRAQLSSYELLVLFYNVVYSEKGEGFKEILKNTKFFDDHLSEKNFIWKNDIIELKQMNQSS